MGLYQKILDGRFSFPTWFTFKAKHFVKELLRADRLRRLGATKGAQVVKDHKWFSKTNWVSMTDRQVETPYTPEMANEGDASHYDNYPDSEEDFAVPLQGDEQQVFEQFEGL